MNILRLITACIITLTIVSAHARMYQWVDPGSGITRFSGIPPVWYRSPGGGPRVFVFDNSRIIDDTDISVSDMERDRLRQKAFLKVEKDRELAKEKLLQAKRLQAVSGQDGEGQEQEQEPDQVNMSEEPVESTDITEKRPPADNPEEAVVNEMRMLIQEWEKQRTESARALLEPAGVTSPP